MASNGVDAEGNPLFPEEDALQSGADLEEVARYARVRGNALVGTTSDRNAFGFKIDGLLWSNTTTDALERWNGTGWERVWAPPIVDQGVTLNAGYSGGPLTVSRVSGMVTLNGRIQATSGAATVIGSLPIGFRPPSERLVQLYDGTAGSVLCIIQTAGDLVMFGKGALAYTDLRMGMAGSWPAVF